MSSKTRQGNKKREEKPNFHIHAIDGNAYTSALLPLRKNHYISFPERLKTRVLGAR
jgi:hypothetical protein